MSKTKKRSEKDRYAERRELLAFVCGKTISALRFDDLEQPGGFCRDRKVKMADVRDGEQP